MQPATEPEEQAILIAWRAEGHSDDEVPAEHAARLLNDVRGRQAMIERSVMQQMLTGAMWEGRRVPRRHQRLVLGAILFIAAVAVIWLSVSR